MVVLFQPRSFKIFQNYFNSKFRRSHLRHSFLQSTSRRLKIKYCSTFFKVRILSIGFLSKGYKCKNLKDIIIHFEKGLKNKDNIIPYLYPVYNHINQRKIIKLVTPGSFYSGIIQLSNNCVLLLLPSRHTTSFQRLYNI